MRLFWSKQALKRASINLSKKVRLQNQHSATLRFLLLEKCLSEGHQTCILLPGHSKPTYTSEVLFHVPSACWFFLLLNKVMADIQRDKIKEVQRKLPFDMLNVV